MIALGLLNSLMAHFASIHMYTIIPLSLTLTAVVSSRMLIFMQDEAHRAKFDTIELEITSSVLRDRFGFGGSTQGESSQTVGAIHDDEVVA
ncbi:hypothetical protein DL96DRAFT_155192 [Flagelloscypha sp. PMI_526]|nr:hypothetical protein DL96DRAFT_155192 [Flagelloscypha sp. PMI_526]